MRLRPGKWGGGRGLDGESLYWFPEPGAKATHHPGHHRQR